MKHALTKRWTNLGQPLFARLVHSFALASTDLGPLDQPDQPSRTHAHTRAHIRGYRLVRLGWLVL